MHIFGCEDLVCLGVVNEYDYLRAMDIDIPRAILGVVNEYALDLAISR